MKNIEAAVALGFVEEAEDRYRLAKHMGLFYDNTFFVKDVALFGDGDWDCVNLFYGELIKGYDHDTVLEFIENSKNACEATSGLLIISHKGIN